MTAGQWFARAATVVVVRSPRLWRLFRGRLSRSFDRLAPEWDTTRASPSRLDAIGAALDGLAESPRSVLDLGTGTGSVARLVAGRWSDAEVTGVDMSAGMVAEARRLTTSGSVRYEVADSSALPFPGGAFDLVGLASVDVLKHNRCCPGDAKWLEETAAGHGVELILIYDSWVTVLI